MAVAMSSRSSERTRRTMFSSALSKGSPRFTSRMTRPNSIEMGGRALAHDELDRLEERGAGAQGVGDEGDRVGQLLVEGREPAVLAPAQPEARQPEAEEHPAQEHDRVAEGREDDREGQHDEGHPHDRGGPDEEVLADLEVQVGPGEVAGEVGPEVALLDGLVEGVERLVARDHLAEVGGLGALGRGVTRPTRSAPGGR